MAHRGGLRQHPPGRLPDHGRPLHARRRRPHNEADVMRENPALFDTPRTLLAAAYWAFVLYLLAPLALMILMSFKDANFIAFPIGKWTLDWYAKSLQDQQFLS